MSNYSALLESGSTKVVQIFVLDDNVDQAAFNADRGTYDAGVGNPTASIDWHRDDNDGEYAVEWVQQTGAGIPGESGYDRLAEVWHNDYFYYGTVDGNVWEPGVSNWHRKDRTWLRPTGSTDVYNDTDDSVVTHQNLWWKSQYEVNSWEPGVFGWVEITEEEAKEWLSSQ